MPAVYHIPSDRREKRSAEKLVAAAQRIILDTEPQRLTVTLLCDEAGTSRTTFYRLFDEPDDVLRLAADQTFHDSLKGYVDLIERAQQHDLSVPDPFQWYEEGVRKNADLIAGFVRIEKTEILKNAHRKALREFGPVLFPDLDPDSEEFLFFTEIRASVFLGGLTAWVESGQKASMDDIRRYAARQMRMFGEI